MHHSVLLVLAIVVPAYGVEPFPLRTDAPPKEWKADQINAGLPLYWEKGTVHVIAWETTEEKGDEERYRSTQILVLKRFDRLTEKGRYRWLLAQLYHDPKNKDEPWYRQEFRIPPVLPGKEMPKVPDAFLYGRELYKDLPTDKELEAFLRESWWRPPVTYRAAVDAKGKAVQVKCITTVVAGGVVRPLWKTLFARDVPANSFPELKKPTIDEK